ncbi:MAG TPA: DUF1800 family protein [Planctomycetaceae bacterium]|nr:DUF1800 family protein [Planctomycetaceae bacterium]
MSAKGISAEAGTGRSPALGRVDPDWAWAPYEPDRRRPWNRQRVGHLFRRAAFGAGWPQVERALAEGPARTVQRLLHPDGDRQAFDRRFDRLDEAVARTSDVEVLRAWWLRRIIETPHPVQEKLTLFWHNHFAISQDTVHDPRLMVRHVQTLRRHALGSYAALLHAVMQDPATLRGLHADANRKIHPSRQLGRALAERFALGPGKAAASDVEGIARAFTGWFVLRGELRFFPSERDPGSKRIFGQTGDFDAHAAVDLVLAHPATSLWIVRQFFRGFPSETDEPDDRLLAPLANDFAKDYDIRRLLARILRSNLFYSPELYLRRVKSPVEFAMGIITGLEGLVPTERLSRELAAMGHALYQPPAGHGWSGGRHWITPASLIARSNLAQWLLTVGGDEPRLDAWRVAGRYGATTPQAAAAWLIDLFLPGGLPSRIRRQLVGDVVGEARRSSAPRAVRVLAHRLSALPEFQLA